MVTIGNKTAPLARAESGSGGEVFELQSVNQLPLVVSLGRRLTSTILESHWAVMRPGAYPRRGSRAP